MEILKCGGGRLCVVGEERGYVDGTDSCGFEFLDVCCADTCTTPCEFCAVWGFNNGNGKRGTGNRGKGNGERGKGYQSSEALPHRQIPSITSKPKYKVHTSHSSSPFGIVLRSTEILNVYPPYVDCESCVVAAACCCDVRDADGCVDYTLFGRQPPLRRAPILI